MPAFLFPITTAKVNRQVTMDVDAGRLTEPHPEATMADEDWADK